MEGSKVDYTAWDTGQYTAPGTICACQKWLVIGGRGVGDLDSGKADYTAWEAGRYTAPSTIHDCQK